MERRDPAVRNVSGNKEGRGEMTKAPIRLQDLRRRLYAKAKSEASWRFWGLFVHVCKWETLREAYRRAKANNGAPGPDGVTFEAIEAAGVEAFLEQIRDELVQGTYQPTGYRRRSIAKADGRGERLLSIGAVEKRLREELARLHVVLNESKSRVVDLAKGDAFGFLGFEFRRVRALSGKWRAHYAPRLKNRTALLRRLKELFRRYQSQPADRVIDLINPILRGWVTYFAVGHSSRCFGYVKDWVEKKVRRHLMRSRKRKGFGWKRWSRRWLYDTLGLFGQYRVYRPKQLRLKALPAR